MPGMVPARCRVSTVVGWDSGCRLCWAACFREIEYMDVIRILLAIILPPVGVFLQVGIGLHFWINILLTLLGYVPGIIHAVWVIVKK